MILTSQVPEPVRFAVSRWWEDPYSRGAWSVLRVGATEETRHQLGEPVSRRLIIAGEATHPNQAGMTHGAYEEGERAARWCAEQGHRSVVVVGAGFAGLGAARSLAKLEIEACIVEARDRIGGRAHTVPLGSAMVEMGANWLQQGDRNPLRALAHANGLRMVATDFNNPLYLGPSETVASLGDNIAFAALEREMAAIRPPDISIAEFLEQWLAQPDAPDAATVRRLVDCNIILESGVPLDDTSAICGWELGVGDGDCWMPSGYRSIAEHLAAGLDIRTTWPVTTVTCLPNSVSVEGPKGSLTSDAVIITVPAAVLKSNFIRFEPALPERHQQALALLATGRVEKISMQFADRWWPHSEGGYLRTVDQAAGRASEWLDLTDIVGTPTVTGIFVAEWADEIWNGRSDADVARSASEALFRAVAAR